MKIKVLIPLAFSILSVFTACGDESNDSSKSLEKQIKQKGFILVINNKNCDINLDKQRFTNYIENNLALPKKLNIDTFLLMSKKDIQFCENYNRTSDEISCVTITWNELTKESCIIGFDFK